jgi:tungstate transport system substrate-binding protein
MDEGDVDALLVHDPIGEDQFVTEGFGVDRREVMYNDFVIIGPSDDPAGIRGLKDARKALAQIAGAKAAFASRGDDSGTHRAELRLWNSAGIEPHNDWHRNIGQGMAWTLNIAATMNAYTLTDRATWENFKGRQNLEILVEGDPRLLNPYASILVNPTKYKQAKFNDALIWHEWLTTKPGLDAITSYRVDGKGLYFPPGKSTALVHSAAALSTLRSISAMDALEDPNKCPSAIETRDNLDAMVYPAMWGSTTRRRS